MGGGASDAQIYINYATYDVTTVAGLAQGSRFRTTGNDSQMADDFSIGGTGFGLGYTITGVTWTGLHGGKNPLVVPGWNIIIYSDAVGTPTGTGFADPTVTALHISVEGVVSSFDEGDSFVTYSTDLTTAFILDSNTRYWIAIQAIDSASGFGLARSMTQQGFGAVSYSEGAIDAWEGLPWDEEIGGDNDIAFNLHGVALPTPGALALLGIAGIFMSRRRREA